MGDARVGCASSDADAPVGRAGPWSFHDHIYGLSNVVLDAECREIASSVPRDCGPLLAAGRELPERIWAISRVAPIGSLAHTIATSTLREFNYRRTTLRIVGECR
jgi:hypothetical protein